MIILRFRSDAVGWNFFYFRTFHFFFNSGFSPPAPGAHPGKGLVTNGNSRNGDPARADHDFFIVLEFCLLRRRRRRFRGGLRLFVFSSLSLHVQNTSYHITYNNIVQMYDFSSDILRFICCIITTIGTFLLSVRYRVNTKYLVIPQYLVLSNQKNQIVISDFLFSSKTYMIRCVVFPTYQLI